MLNPPHPRAVVEEGDPAGAAGHEATHGMPDEGDRLDLDRPVLGDRVQEFGQAPAVVRDVPAGVVPDLQRRVPQVRPEPFTVGGTATQCPRVLGLDESVQEDDDAATGAREGVGERARVRCERDTVHPYRQGCGERRPLRFQYVADQTLDRGDGLGSAACLGRGDVLRRREIEVPSCEGTTETCGVGDECVRGARDLVVEQFGGGDGVGATPSRMPAKTRSEMARWMLPMPVAAAPDFLEGQPGEGPHLGAASDLRVGHEI